MRNGRGAALLLAGTIATLVACGGGGGSTSGPAPAGTKSIQGTATLTIPNRTTQGTSRKPAFISASVLSATVAVNGTVVVTADLSPTSTICQTTNSLRTCTIPLAAPAGTDTFIVTLYDGPNGTGHVLGIGTATQAISGTSFTLPITVGGQAFTVVLGADTGPLQVGSPTTVPLTVTAKDAGGNVIAGSDPFASPITLTDSDTSGHTHLTTTSLTSPQTEVALNYDGGTLTGPVTIGATGGGATTITPVTIPVGTAATPPSFGFAGNGYACSGTAQLPLPATYFVFISEGSIDSGGDYASSFGEWAPIQFLAASPLPTLTPAPTVSPIPTGSPTSTVTLYTGTFTLSSTLDGMNTGCFYAISLPAQQTLTSTVRAPFAASPSPSPTPNAFAIGAPNIGFDTTVGTVGTVGTITAFQFTVTNGTGSGTFTLDNEVTGTISITGHETFTFSEKRLKLANRIREAMQGAHRRR
jgi:hypothetical protein